MAPNPKILNHPDKEWLIDRLTAGDSVRSIAAHLNDKYPARSQTHLRLSASTLQNFRADFLNLKGEVLADITEAGQLTRENIKHEMQMDEVRQTGAYREAIQAIADERLDVQRELIEIFHILKSRLEVMFDRVSVNGFNDKQERALKDLTAQMLDALEKYKKFVEGYSEKTESTININIMQGQVSLIREAVREVISDLDPELAVKFMGRLNEKMRALQYREAGSIPVQSARVHDIVVAKVPEFPTYSDQDIPENLPSEPVDG